MLKRLLAILAILSFYGTTYGQDFSIDAQVKPRYEHRNGFGQLRPTDNNADRPADFVSQRTRIRMLFNDKSEKFRMGFSMQDVRTWGEVGNFANKDYGNFNIHEAWGELLFTDAFSVKVGRQEISYDDQRIFGAVDWAQQARSHDAAIFKYEKGFKLHAGFAISTFGESNYYIENDGNAYKAMQYLWFHKDFENFKLSGLFLNNGVEQNTTNAATPQPADFETVYSQTLGAHGEWRPGKFGLNASFYYQFGKTGAAKQDISAYNALLELLFNANEKLGFIVGGEMLSGTAYDETETYMTFNPFYGTNHKFNGHMDYFYVGGRMPRGGLTDLYVGATYKFDKDWNVYGRYHYFASAATIADNNGNELDSGLGSEIDLIINYKFNKYITIQGGWSGMFATDSMVYSTAQNNPGDPNKFNNWGWMGLVIKPTLFTTKKKEVAAN
ncbi:alginate export family protein [Flammeovirga sp. SubArs3]|uniref:alginate export family protein n=1 Tax=Flammeovirga sp. SubArs3 TaxID=2995316 RepID=UPI00248A9523|nr:alginate export family protein [Flammeovirga sp. SubArs3]